MRLFPAASGSGAECALGDVDDNEHIDVSFGILVTTTVKTDLVEKLAEILWRTGEIMKRVPLGPGLRAALWLTSRGQPEKKLPTNQSWRRCR